MPRISKDTTEKEIQSSGAEELVFIGHETPKPHCDMGVNQNRYDLTPGRWNAPQLNLHAARAVRHEEIKLGRALTQDEQTALLRKLTGSPA